MARFSGWHLTRTGILFVIGIIVLGGLVTGGVFLIKNHGEMVRRDQAAKVAEQNLKNESKTTTTTTVATDSGTKTTTSTNSASTTNTNTNGGSGTTTATSNTATSQLPVTGIDPISTIETAGILAILAFSVTSFVASRRAAARG